MSENVSKSLEEEIKMVIAEAIERDPNELSMDANFWKDLGVDSIKAIEITVAIEKRYGVAIRDEQIPRISTVREAVVLVKKLLEKKNK